MKAGIVGLPNVGKSTLFNALTASKNAESANYPFCTIEPNVGIVQVMDPRLSTIQKYIPCNNLVYASVEIVDIAGLVRGASKGEGLGNQFLGHIRNVDAILHVVRCFDDDNVIHVEGKVDPLSDIDTIELELILSDLSSVEGQIQRLQKRIRSGDQEAQELLQILEKANLLLQDSKPVRAGHWSTEEIKALRIAGLLTYKPVLYICNVDEGSVSSGNRYSEMVAQRAKAENSSAIYICAQFEAEVSEMEDINERKAFLADMGVNELGLDRVAKAAYGLLGLDTYFTAGVKEIRAWTIIKGSTAPQAAGVIHSDFEKGFIRAQVYHLEDLIKFESESALKTAGKIRAEGKEYIMKDGDICHFLFNV
jgi:GTP-binding protein YchF